MGPSLKLGSMCPMFFFIPDQFAHDFGWPVPTAYRAVRLLIPLTIKGWNVSQVRWIIYLRVKFPEKASPLLDRFAEAVGKKIAVLEGGRYWKDQSLFRVVAICELAIDDVSSALLATLQMCWGLARSWILAAPQVYH